MPRGNGGPKNDNRGKKTFKKGGGAAVIEDDPGFDKEVAYHSNSRAKTKKGKAASQGINCLCHFRCDCDDCIETGGSCPIQISTVALEKERESGVNYCTSCEKNTPEKRKEIANKRAEDAKHALNQ